MQSLTTIHFMFKLFTLTMMHLQSHAPQVCTWKHLCCLTNVFSFFLSFILFLGFLKDKQSLVGADCHVPKVVVTSRHCIPQFAVDDGKLQKKAVHRNTKSWGTFTHTAVTVRYTHLPDTVKPQPVFHWSLGRTIKQQQKKNRRAPPSRSRLQSHVYEEALQPVNALVHQ